MTDLLLADERSDMSVLHAKTQCFEHLRSMLRSLATPDREDRLQTKKLFEAIAFDSRLVRDLDDTSLATLSMSPIVADLEQRVRRQLKELRDEEVAEEERRREREASRLEHEESLRAISDAYRTNRGSTMRRGTKEKAMKRMQMATSEQRRHGGEEQDEDEDEDDTLLSAGAARGGKRPKRDDDDDDDDDVEWDGGEDDDDDEDDDRHDGSTQRAAHRSRTHRLGGSGAGRCGAAAPRRRRVGSATAAPRRHPTFAGEDAWGNREDGSDTCLSMFGLVGPTSRPLLRPAAPSQLRRARPTEKLQVVVSASDGLKLMTVHADGRFFGRPFDGGDGGDALRLSGVDLVDWETGKDAGSMSVFAPSLSAAVDEEMQLHELVGAAMDDCHRDDAMRDGFEETDAVGDSSGWWGGSSLREHILREEVGGAADDVTLASSEAQQQQQEQHAAGILVVASYSDPSSLNTIVLGKDGSARLGTKQKGSPLPVEAVSHCRVRRLRRADGEAMDLDLTLDLFVAASSDRLSALMSDARPQHAAGVGRRRVGSAKGGVTGATTTATASPSPHGASTAPPKRTLIVHSPADSSVSFASAASSLVSLSHPSLVKGVCHLRDSDVARLRPNFRSAYSAPRPLRGKERTRPWNVEVRPENNRKWIFVQAYNRNNQGRWRHGQFADLSVANLIAHWVSEQTDEAGRTTQVGRTLMEHLFPPALRQEHVGSTCEVVVVAAAEDSAFDVPVTRLRIGEGEDAELLEVDWVGTDNVGPPPCRGVVQFLSKNVTAGEMVDVVCDNGTTVRFPIPVLLPLRSVEEVIQAFPDGILVHANSLVAMQGLDELSALGRDEDAASDEFDLPAFGAEPTEGGGFSAVVGLGGGGEDEAATTTAAGTHEDLEALVHHQTGDDLFDLIA